MKIAVYPGSFDPITLGHLDIVSRVSPAFDKLIVLIAQNAEKKNLFTPEERVRLAKDVLKPFSNVEVLHNSGLTVEFAKNLGARFLIRGLRSESDFHHEWVVANMNRDLAPGIETLMIFAKPELSHISSRAVKEVAMNGGNLARWVPPVAAGELLKKLSR